MANKFRLYGPEVGESTAIVDADVTGAGTDGSIELTPSDGSLEPFTLDSERLRELADDDLAYDYADIDTDAERWGAIKDVEDHYLKATNDKKAFRTAAKTLFQG